MQYQQPFDQPLVPNAPYQDGNATNGTPGSIPRGAGIEHPQREIVNALAAASLTAVAGDLTQLTQAMSIGLWLNTMGGTANAISDTLPTLATTSDGITQYAIPALLPGMTFHGIIPATNTGPATLNLLGFGTAPGAKAIVRKDGTPLQPGDQIGGAIGTWKWDGTAYRIMGMVQSDVLALIQSTLLITTAVTKVVGTNAGADFADLNAAFAWLSQYRITATGSVVFQCQAGKFGYTKTILAAHPDLQRVKVLGAAMKAACPVPAAIAITGSSASARSTDAANTLATLRASFATELAFSGGTGFAIQGPLAGLDALLLTGDGTSPNTGPGTSGIGLGLGGGCIVANASGIAVCGFGAGVYIRNSAAIQGDPGTGTGGPIIVSGNAGTGIGITGEGCLTCLSYSTTGVGSFSNGSMGIQVDGMSVLQALNCGPSHSRGNGVFGVYMPGSGNVQVSSSSYISANGSGGVVLGQSSTFAGANTNITYNGSSGGIQCYTGPISVDVTGANIASNTGPGISVYGNGFVRAAGAAFSGNGTAPIQASDGAVVLVTGATGTSGSSPAVGTVGNGNALITT